MKKTYEKPVLTTEQFDVQDIITVRSGAPVLGAASVSWRRC